MVDFTRQIKFVRTAGLQYFRSIPYVFYAVHLVLQTLRRFLCPDWSIECFEALVALTSELQALDVTISNGIDVVL
jgi:hypothetical protein